MSSKIKPISRLNPSTNFNYNKTKEIADITIQVAGSFLEIVEKAVEFECKIKELEVRGKEIKLLSEIEKLKIRTKFATKIKCLKENSTQFELLFSEFAKDTKHKHELILMLWSKLNGITTRFTEEHLKEEEIKHLQQTREHIFKYLNKIEDNTFQGFNSFVGGLQNSIKNL